MEGPPFDDLAFLGLSEDVTLARLKATRKALVKEFHPDRFHTPEEKAEAHEQTVRINAAYDRVLTWGTSNFHVLDPAMGAKKWERVVTGTLTANSSSMTRMVHLATSEGKLFALNGPDGGVLWEKSCAKGVYFSSLHAGPMGRLYAFSSDGRLTVYAERGYKNYRITSKRSATNSPSPTKVF